MIISQDCLLKDEVQEAYTLLKDLEPTVPQEYILKGVVNSAIGQETGSVSFIKFACLFLRMLRPFIMKKLSWQMHFIYSKFGFALNH